MSGYAYNAQAAAAALAAQRQRDELDSIRELMQPDFATSCRIAANRRTAAALAPKDRPVLPPQADTESYLLNPFRHVIGPFQPEAIERAQLKEITQSVKATRKEMDQAEAAAIAIQTFIGPRTPESAIIAEAVRAGHEAKRKNCLAVLKDLHPAFAKLRSHVRSEEIEAALADFVNESEEHTGMSLSPDQYAATLNKKQKLREMSAEICRRLESVGVETKRPDGCGLWTYWIHSNVWEVMDQYRRICINPVVAAAKRAPIIAALEYYLQENAWCRFWTFTTGPRCTIAEIPDRLDVWIRKLSKLNHILKRDWAFEFVIATTEFGTVETEKKPKENDDEGRIEFVRLLNEETGLHTDEPVFHPHFHVVARSLIGWRPDDKWQDLCRFVRSFWGAHCDLTGGKNGALIRNAREIVKYVTKPGDLLKLTPLQLKAFYEATANRRLVRPLGSLRREIAVRKEEAKTLRRVRCSGGGFKWVEKIDHNKTLADTMSKEDRADMDAIIESEVFASELEAGIHAGGGPVEMGESITLWNDGSAHRQAAGLVMAEGLPVRLKDKPDFCQVVAFIPPAAGPTMRKENRVIVMGNRRDEQAVNRHPLVKQLRERTWTAWASGEVLAAAEASAAAAGIYVHTGTLTVSDEPENPDPWTDSKPLQLVFETA